jgi:hypothetical protein
MTVAESSYTERFELMAGLYYRRYHRLAPGKSEPAALCRDSSSDENRTQYDTWLGSLAYGDLQEWAIWLEKRVLWLEERMEISRHD